MKIGSIVNGFKVIRARRLAELDATLWEMEHVKTGAELAWLDRKDENKAFSIAFKTLPEDSTGVFHILEHSVLCGSDKYPVKEPFVELLKSSVQTFLNAFTYPDKTVYPVSSRNDRDFLNLIDVYLDAVLHPAIYHKPEIFRQEGWRYEGEGENLCYSGVVFNEMKGAFASPQTVMYNEMQRVLFPDNSYRFVSGGDPACIPDLTYEQFIANHKKYYHPSNARISLIGSIDVDAVLNKIDSFLSAYDRQKADFTIPMQSPIDSVVEEVPFAIGEEEPAENRAIIACASVLGRFDEQERNFAGEVLSDYLAGDNDAPLKRAVLDSGIAQDFSILVEDGIQQPIFGWQAMNTDADKREALEATVRKTIENIVSDGLDHKRLSACLHSFAFRMREREGGWLPRSLNEGLSMLNTWLYGGDPADGLLVEASLKSLEEKLSGDYFGNLMKELFLDNPHTATIVLVPSKALGRERNEREAARVKAESEAWTEADRARIAKDAEALALWQQTPDSPEALAAIPMLKLSDLSDKPEPLSMTETKQDGVTVLRNTVGSELALVRASFRINELTTEELPALSILTNLLGALATKRHTRSELPLAIKNVIGRLNFTPTLFPGTTPENCRVLLTASVACLSEQAEEAANLLSEILTETLFDDVDLVRDILQQAAVGARMSLPSNGHRYGMMRVASYCTAQGLANECIGGVSFMQWLNRMLEAGEDALKELLNTMRGILERLVTKERLTVSCSEATPDAAIDALIAAVPSEGVEPKAEACYRPSGSRQEGIVIPAQVGFAVTGTNLQLHDRVYTGSIPVLSKLLSFTYLWNEIRVKGGAYGCGFNGRDTGELFFYTYRDPQPDRSLNVIAESAAYVRSFLANVPDLTGFILSAVSTLDPLRTAEDKITASEARFFRGMTGEYIIERYRALIGTNREDLLELCDVLDEIAKDNAVCVIAGESALDACGEKIKDRVTV